MSSTGQLRGWVSTGDQSKCGFDALHPSHCNNEIAFSVSSEELGPLEHHEPALCQGVRYEGDGGIGALSVCEM